MTRTLGKTVYGPLIWSYSKVCSEYLCKNPTNLKIRQTTWPALFSAWEYSATPNIKPGFKTWVYFLVIIVQFQTKLSITTSAFHMTILYLRLEVLLHLLVLPHQVVWQTHLPHLEIQHQPFVREIHSHLYERFNLLLFPLSLQVSNPLLNSLAFPTFWACMFHHLIWQTPLAALLLEHWLESNFAVCWSEFDRWEV